MKKPRFFSPLYISNYCDAYCKMCTLRKTNNKVVRQELSIDEIKAELMILMQNGIKGVSFLTGEYYDPLNRERMINKVVDSCKLAHDLGFEDIIINIGSLTYMESSKFQNLGFPITLAMFMETYNQELYNKWMTSKGGKSDYQLRMDTYSHWIQLKNGPINLGILIGLNKDINEDIKSLLVHADFLLSKHIEIYISLPRITSFNSSIDNDQYLQIFKKISEKYKTVITNRENLDNLKKLKDDVFFFSPGLPIVGAYSQSSKSTGQFPVNVHKMPWEIIKELYTGLAWSLALIL